MPQSILYYPTINIKNTPWLRSAALYWDQVCSIVPDAQYYQFSPEILYMTERGQYRPIYPQDFLVSQYADAFSVEVLRRLNRVYYQARRKREISLRRAVTSDFTNSVKLHQAKIPYNTLKQMLESGFVRLSDEEGWLEADSRTAGIYMKTLAEYIVRFDEHDIVTGTDRKTNFDSLYHRTGLRKYSHLFELSLVDILPIPAPDVGFEAILDFKERRRTELEDLHRVIHELERNLSHCQSREEMKTLLEDFKSTWQRQLILAEKMFRGDGIGFALDSLRSFVADAGGAAAIAQIISPNQPRRIIEAALGGGLVGVCIQYRNYRSRIKEEQKEQGFAYVIGAGRNGLLRDYP
jgi:hypothetical protein